MDNKIKTQGISTKKLSEKINKLKLEKILNQRVVNLNEYRKLKPAASSKSILIVDDDEMIRHSLKKIFLKEGYSVLLAQDGTDLGKYLEEQPLSVVMLDINLPWVDGYDLCSLIKEHDDLRHVPIVFISGKSSEADIRKGYDVGCDDYVTKPFDVDELIKRINQLLVKSLI